ncbi:hypothetical protein VTO73DRAFT_10414 [Trametes versicolor]
MLLDYLPSKQYVSSTKQPCTIRTARPTTWLVTGANRGIGLEIVKQLLASPTNLVIAGVRTPEKATALRDLQTAAKGTLHIIKLDVSDFASVRGSTKDLEAILGDTGLDYLINNAGVGPRDTAFTIDPEVLLETFKTNSIGPVLVSQVALPFLEKGSTKKIAHISSTCGSSALNMLAYKQKLERPDFTVLTLCPGAVKTDMSGGYWELEPPESVAGLLKQKESSMWFSGDLGHLISAMFVSPVKNYRWAFCVG